MNWGDENTRWGFIWGGIVEVTRVMQYRGSRVIRLKTPHRDVEICVSPTGRSVRVWIDGRLLK